MATPILTPLGLFCLPLIHKKNHKLYRRAFQPSLVPIGPVVSKTKIKM